MLTVLYLLVNTITCILAVNRTYEFINVMTILYLMYWTYSQMDV